MGLFEEGLSAKVWLRFEVQGPEGVVQVGEHEGRAGGGAPPE